VELVAVLSSLADFETAAEDAKSLPEDIGNDDKLLLYALYKQVRFHQSPFSLCPAW
jgi:acyl-CoA-binding protein